MFSFMRCFAFTHNSGLSREYIEIIFPDYDVRYIAINDGVDTLNSENELMAFKNIVSVTNGYVTILQTK